MDQVILEPKTCRCCSRSLKFEFRLHSPGSERSSAKSASGEILSSSCARRASSHGGAMSVGGYSTRWKIELPDRAIKHVHVVMQKVVVLLSWGDRTTPAFDSVWPEQRQPDASACGRSLSFKTSFPTHATGFPSRSFSHLLSHDRKVSCTGDSNLGEISVLSRNLRSATLTKGCSITFHN